MASIDMEQVRSLIRQRLESINPSLLNEINRSIHNNPETAYQEFFAHDTMVKYLENLGLDVDKHSYGIATSFEARLGSGGRQIVFCAEYDALPGIGHACGHNLIATSSIAAFLGAAHVLKMMDLPGRLRLLGTPAEEGLCGKSALIDKGAFSPSDDIAAAIMAHAVPASLIDAGPGESGLAGFKLIASHMFKTEFKGQTAHAAGEPWKGTNALDAAVSAYNNVSLLRQQIHPLNRIHTVIEAGGTVPNVITDYTRMHWNVRSPTIQGADALLSRVKLCVEAAATATGCTLDYINLPTYLNMRANRSLCQAYTDAMRDIGEIVAMERDQPSTASTDMGNVSHIVPSFHGAFTIPVPSNVSLHSPEFEVAASTDEAHLAAMQCAKGMAMLAVRLLVDDALAADAKYQFCHGD